MLPHISRRSVCGAAAVIASSTALGMLGAAGPVRGGSGRENRHRSDAGTLAPFDEVYLGRHIVGQRDAGPARRRSSPWQQEHPSSSCLPVDSTPNVAALHDVMRPWGDITPADVLDHTRFYTHDRPVREKETLP